MENCCLFAEIFSISYQQRCGTSHLKQKETAEFMTDFRAINGLLNSHSLAQALEEVGRVKATCELVLLIL